MPTVITTPVPSLRPLMHRHRPHIRTRVYVLPETHPKPHSPGHSLANIDSQQCLLEESVFSAVFGFSSQEAASRSQPLYVAVQIPSLTPPKISEPESCRPDSEPLDDVVEDLDPEARWKILSVKTLSEKGSELISIDNSGTVGTVGVPVGLFSSLGASTGGAVGTGRNRGVGVTGFIREVRIMDLERVVVCVRHPASQRFSDDNTVPENVSVQYLAAIQDGLKRTNIVREGDELVIDGTFSPSSTATIELSEPLEQGILTPNTQVVVRVERDGAKGRSKVKTPVRTTFGVGRARKPMEFDPIREENELSDGHEEMESEDNSDGLLDLSDDDSIMALAPASSVLAGLGMGTGMGTPGSMISAFTTGQPKSAVFGARILTRPVQREAIVPLPNDEDDDDRVRIFARPGGLVRVGVMAGDWVWIENAQDLTSSFGLGGSDDDPGRAVRIYAAPGSHTYNQSPSSNHDLLLSPFLYGNLGCPSSIRVSRLIMNAKRVRMSSGPPAAAEVRLVRIASQVGMEKRAQVAVVAGVKRFFGKRRVISQGDLLAIKINIGEGDDTDDSLGPSLGNGADGEAGNDVVWFRVAVVDGHAANEKDGGESSIRNWGCATVEPSETTLVQAGAEQRRVFGGTEWREYLGLPKSGTGTMAGAFQGASISTPNPLLSRLILLFSAAAHPSQLLPPTRLLLTGKRSSGKAWMVHAAAAAIGMHVFEIDCWDVLASERDVQVEGLLRARIERAVSLGTSSSDSSLSGVRPLTETSTVVLLRNIDVLGHLPLEEVLKPARLVIGTASPDAAAVDDQVRSIFSHELSISVPGEKEREHILRSVLSDRNLPLGRDVQLNDIARRTAALVAGDLVDLINRVEIFRRKRIDKSVKSLGKDGSASFIDAEIAGGPMSCLSKPDFDSAVDAARKNFADAIGAPKIPSVTWNDVGGLAHVRAAVTETIQLPLARPELFASGLKKRSGILFYGPPGTGKTLVAKAIATEYGLNFFSVKGPELLNMYIGESEANVRRVFQKARDARPCVVFFDELDSVAPKRGNQGDSGGVMDRIVAQLLAELDGMSGSSGDSDGDSSADAGGVFVVGATNRPDLLDQALLRPGRFDKIVYLGLPDTVAKRVNVMQALTRKFTMSDNVDFNEVVRDGGLTGADLYALCADAMLGAVGKGVETVRERMQEIEAQKAVEAQDKGVYEERQPLTVAQFFDYHATKDDLQVTVRQEDFVKARRELVPSVSAKELRHYEKVRDLFEGKDNRNGDLGEISEDDDLDIPLMDGLSMSDPLRTDYHEKGALVDGSTIVINGDKGKDLAEHESRSLGFGVGGEDDGLYDDDGVKLS